VSTDSEIPALYEVVMGQNVAYTDASGRYFVFGHLFDMQTQRDLTAERLEKQQRVAFSELPFADAIKTVRGKGERVLAVFSDPDCPYCQRLESELEKLDNLTLYTFAYPLESLHPDAKDKAVSVWCAPDRARAWAELMKSGKAPAKRSCDHPVDRNIALAQRLGIQGTPTLLSADGRVLPGCREQRANRAMAGGEPAMSRAGVFGPFMLVLSLPALLAGCAGTMSGLDGQGKFSCKAPDGIACASLAGVYANALQNNLPGQERPEKRTTPKVASPGHTPPSTITRPVPSSGEPIRSAQKCDGYGWRPGRTTRKCCTTSRTSTSSSIPVAGSWHTRDATPVRRIGP
jgi:thiol:disulfide interchange protein DsbC